MDDDGGDDDDRTPLLEGADDEDAVRRFPPFDDTLRWTLTLCVRGGVSGGVTQALGDKTRATYICTGARYFEQSFGLVAPCLYDECRAPLCVQAALYESTTLQYCIACTAPSTALQHHNHLKKQSQASSVWFCYL